VLASGKEYVCGQYPVSVQLQVLCQDLFAALAPSAQLAS